VAILAGLIIGKLAMENYLEDWVRAMQAARSAKFQPMPPSWNERIDAGAVPSRSKVEGWF
jgi:hypothetical protein